jgi:hypothetical protein
MSFPIFRADLNNVESPKLNINNISTPDSSTFVERRIHTLSKQIISAALAGNKTYLVNIIVAANVEPISVGLKENFPDLTFTISNNSNEEPDEVPRRPHGPATSILVDWS